MHGRLPTCALLCALAFPWPAEAAAQPAKDLSVELIFGGALEGTPPSDYAWSDAWTHLAFLRRETAESPHLLQLFDAATSQTVTLSLPHSGDKPLDVESFSWSPDGGAILALAGGDLYLVSTSSESGTRRLTETVAAESNARVSPDGKRVAFVRDHDLFLLDLATGRERALTQGRVDGIQNAEIDWVYDEEFEIADGWLWSPDSSRIAYLQFDERPVPTYPIVDWIPTHPEVEPQRYPKSGDPNPIVRLGIVAVGSSGKAAPTTLWLDLGRETDQYIPRFAWTGDGGSVAVQRLNRDQTRLELLFCDPAKGTCRGVLEERDDKWINIGDDWRFLNAGAGGA
ncbi:MAG TPA: DPP IV N-terminal domain-containing protein, partial [Candidatus Polarisedimenticolia bacterium]|nr:DPP IV N-terminal domain-containing protein [Candidatus Polarisedimenticolia bacterium]